MEYTSFHFVKRRVFYWKCCVLDRLFNSLKIKWWSINLNIAKVVVWNWLEMQIVDKACSYLSIVHNEDVEIKTTNNNALFLPSTLFSHRLSSLGFHPLSRYVDLTLCVWGITMLIDAVLLIYDLLTTTSIVKNHYFKHILKKWLMWLICIVIYVTVLNIFEHIWWLIMDSDI